MEKKRLSVPETAKQIRETQDNCVKPLIYNDKMSVAISKMVKGSSLIAVGSSHNPEPTENYAGLLNE